MPTRSIPFTFLCLSLALSGPSVLIAASAHADPNPPAPAAAPVPANPAPTPRNALPSSDPQAAAHRANGLALEAKYDYLGAIAEYQLAHEIDKSAHLQDAATDLEKIGVCDIRISRFPDALNELQQALSIQQQINDKQGEARALNDIGRVYRNTSQYSKALGIYQKVLLLERQIGDKSEEAKTLNNAGVAYDDLSQHEKALDFFKQALRIRQQMVDTAGEAGPLSNIGMVLDELGRRENSLKFYQRALAIEQEIGNKHYEVSTLNNISIVYMELTQYSRAIEIYQQILPIQQLIEDKPGEGGTLSNIGLAYDYLGNYAKALDFYQKSLTIQQMIDDKQGEASTLNNIGLIYVDLHNYAKAQDLLEQALSIKQQIGSSAGAASILCDIGGIYDDRNEYVKALDYYRQALLIQRQTKDKQGETRTLDNIGNVYEATGKYDKALGFYEQALSIRLEIMDQAGESITLSSIGKVYDDLRQHTKALSYYQKSLTIERRIRYKAFESWTLSDMMSTWKALGKPDVAIFYGKEAVNGYQSIRANISTLDNASQKSYLKSVEDAYHTLADLLIEQGRLPEAEQVLGLLKEQELIDYIQRNTSLVPLSSRQLGYDAQEKRADAQEQILDAQLFAIATRIDGLKRKKTLTDQDKALLAVLQIKLQSAEKKYQAFLAIGLPKELAQANAATKRRARALQETAQGARQTENQAVLHDLGPGTVALYTLVEPDKVRIVVVTAQAEKAEQSLVSSSQLRRLVAAWRDALSDPSADPRPLGRKIYDILIGPIKADLAAAHAKVLMWSLDDVLRYVPMAALYDGKHYLVERYQTDVMSGASLDRYGTGSDADWSVLGLGVSKPHEGFPALTGVPAELKGIIKGTGGTGLLPGVMRLDDQFTQKQFLSDLSTSSYPVVHIASHFSFGGDYASSFLLLGDGSHFSLSDFLGQKRILQGVDLLTLSACETGREGSDDADGHEVESFGMLAQKKGASSIIASLWPIADDSTRLLMEDFYRRHSASVAMTKAAALQAAQLGLLHGDGASGASARYAHPYYWAPFILIGSWK